MSSAQRGGRADHGYHPVRDRIFGLANQYHRSKGIMFHPGSYPKDTMGCILVGHNPRKGNGEVQPKLYNSCAKYKLLKDYIVEAYKKGDNITVEIVEV